jgi:hypothetical protein
MPRPSTTLTPPAPPFAEDHLFEVEVTATPAKPDDDVFVTIQEIDGGKHKHGPVVWAPRVKEDGVYYVKKGTEGLLVRVTETGELWLVEWSLLPGQEPDAKFSTGGTGSDANYVHEQGVASHSWEINHKLGKIPCVIVFAESGEQMEPQVVIVDANNIKLEFNIDVNGKAVLN